MRKPWWSGVVVLAAAASACSTSGERPEAVRVCAPDPDASLPPGATLAERSGEYELVLVATEGPRAGDTVRAELTLREHDDELRRVRGAGGAVRDDATAPLYGWIELEPTPLGTINTGALDARDPAAPGVGVYETRRAGDPAAPPSIVLRLGSAANRRGSTPFDGGYTVLRVDRIDENGFAGSWSSGTESIAAGGHFCAVQMGG